MQFYLLIYLYNYMSEVPSSTGQQINKRVLAVLRNPKINTFTSDYIVQLLTQQSLVKIQQFMRKSKTLKLTGFLRFFRQLLPFARSQTSQQIQLFLHYGLFKFFQEICNNKKKLEISFSDISSYIAEKMPNFTQQNKIQQKMLPLGLNIDDRYKAHITPPEIHGQILQDRCFLTLRPLRSDRIQHLSRDVGQSQYSKKFKLYFSIDKPSTIISILDDDFNTVQTLKTQQEMTKRDMIVNYIAWSDREAKIACILGNYSISMWSKEDNYKYQVNIPLPGQYLSNPFIMIKYMDSMRRWITLDNRPVIYVLDQRNYEPEYFINNSKIRKKKQTQKIHLCELHYVQLLCIAFQRSLFLVSLKNKQVLSQITSYTTSVTSIAFSQSYQALFVSTYEKYFRSYQLSEFQDLIQKGKFQGHKTQISLLGVIDQKPIVFSLQQNSVLKMFDMRDYSCYQTFSVLKNILYKQVVYLNDAICLVGSKMHVYGIQKQLTFKEKQLVIYMGTLRKDLLIVTNKCIKVYDIRNGALKSVIKAIFGQSQTACDIVSVFILQKKEKLFIQSEQGQCAILQTRQMSKIQTWKLQSKPFYMYFDEQHDLLTQVSLGNIYINQYYNQYSQKQLRRQIMNQKDIVRFIKVSSKHDLIVICYQNDENLYFYAYEKGKMLGYLDFGQKKVIKFKNAYKPQKVIHRFVDLQFYQNKNLIFVLLSDELLVLTYKRSINSMMFLSKKQIKLWQSPLKLTNNTQYIYDQKKLQEPLYSTGIALFQTTLAITSNKSFIISCIQCQIAKISGIQQYHISKDNYNPTRIGNENHMGPYDMKNPMITIKDPTSASFLQAYYVYKHKLGDFTQYSRIGNLLAIADNSLNILLVQTSNWNLIGGVINCEQTLPQIWNIFKYSQQQLKEVQFILNFIQNEQKIPQISTIKGLNQQNTPIKQPKDAKLEQITISQLIKEDKAKNGQLKVFRSSSLRQKKMILEKQREERQKIQNFIEQQKLQKKLQPNTSLRNNAQKQINENLGYFSINHNETILKRGIIEQDLPAVKALQMKLNIAINKEQKKSLISYKTGDESTKTKKMLDSMLISPAKQLAATKTISTQIFEGLTQKIGLQSYNSRQLIQKLNSQKLESQRKLKTMSKNTQSLPKIKRD